MNTAPVSTLTSLSSIMPLLFASLYVYGRVMKALIGRPGWLRVVAPIDAGTSPSESRRLSTYDPFTETSQLTTSYWTGRTVKMYSQPRLRTAPRFAARDVAPVPSDGASTALMIAPSDFL